MDIDWATTTINPKELIHISRGDRKVIYKYLIQFKELIPKRIDSLEKSLENLYFLVGEYKTSLRTIYSIQNTRIVELITSRLVRAPNFHFCDL